KITLFTNHRSLKEAKTKPFKTEVLIAPTYTIFVQATEKMLETIKNALINNRFKYTPVLGHSYCPARVAGFKEYVACEVSPEGKTVSTVVLDEALEVNGSNSSFTWEGSNADSAKPARIVLERHLHHYWVNGKLEKRVLRYWIPFEGSELEIDKAERKMGLTHFFELDGVTGKAVCLF
ncbi:hypothetical protein HY991_04940, partial [Candidatus Micrarchaeota archaeon]|nr:hypothetical protein [Candidatus Micrarchaeota archaeon]